MTKEIDQEFEACWQRHKREGLLEKDKEYFKDFFAYGFSQGQKESSQIEGLCEKCMHPAVMIRFKNGYVLAHGKKGISYKVCDICKACELNETIGFADDED